MTKTVGVVLSGCGYLDGSEIHEAVCSLLALSRAGATVQCFAPDMDFDVVDHRTGEATGERRNVLAEAARIARGQVKDLREADPNALDALILPGGYGAAKNLSDFAFKGAECSILDSLASLVQAMHAAGKPIGAVCIAPALLAKLLPGVTLTIGNDAATADALETLGAIHQTCPVDEAVLDIDNRVVTAPAYMCDASLSDVSTGIDRCVEQVLGLIG